VLFGGKEEQERIQQRIKTIKGEKVKNATGRPQTTQRQCGNDCPREKKLTPKSNSLATLAIQKRYFFGATYCDDFHWSVLGGGSKRGKYENK